MGPLAAALLLNSMKSLEQGQRNSDKPNPVKIANQRFRDFVGAQKSLSVHITLHRKDIPGDGAADLIMVSPDKIFFHLVWGREDYTYTVEAGRATEIDRGGKLYDEYPVPYAGAPTANGSYWVLGFFPTVFVDPNVILPENSIDANGKITQYTVRVGDPPASVDLIFSDYKTGITVPESKFQISPPAGFVSYSTQDLPPPLEIGQKLPNVTLSHAGSRDTNKLSEELSGKKSLVAILSPDSKPGIASIPTLREIKGARVVIVNLKPSGTGIQGGALPVLFDPQGGVEKALRAYRSPTFYLLDESGKITNVWYGFSRARKGLFAKQVKEALSSQ